MYQLFCGLANKQSIFEKLCKAKFTFVPIETLFRKEKQLTKTNFLTFLPKLVNQLKYFILKTFHLYLPTADFNTEGCGASSC